MKKLNPTGSKVLISLIIAGNQQVGSLAIPEQFQDKTSADGIVVGIGPKVDNVKVGDRVVIPRYDGTEIKVDGKIHKLFNENELLAVIEQD